MENRTLFEKATDPKLYDSKDLEAWVETEGKLDDQSRKDFFQVIKDCKNKWKNSRVLDIGCGTGWLSYEINKHARKVIGIDPSKKNIEFAKKNFRNIKFENISFENFKEKSFDVIIANMVFEHIKDINSSFEKISNMLNENGEFELVVGDYNYFKSKRKSYDLNVEKLDDESYVVETPRNEGLTKDVIRKVEVYIRAGMNAGLELIHSSKVYNNEKKVMGHFLRFRKKKNEFSNNLIACIGISTIGEKEVFSEIEEIGSLLIRKEFGIIHGGYCGGAMEAVSKGAQNEIKKLDKNNNLNIGIPFTIFDSLFERNSFGKFSKQTNDILERLGNIIDNSFAILVLPEGGIGTMTELIYAFHLNQIYKLIGLDPKPIILYGKSWRNIIENILEKLDLINEGEEWLYYVNNLNELEDVLEFIKN